MKKYALLIIVIACPVAAWQESTYNASAHHFAGYLNLTGGQCHNHVVFGALQAANSNSVFTSDEIVLMFKDEDARSNESCERLGRSMGFALKNNNPTACYDFFDRVGEYSHKYGLTTWTVIKCDYKLWGSDLKDFIELLASNWKRDMWSEGNITSLKVLSLSDYDDNPLHWANSSEYRGVNDEDNSTYSGGGFTLPHFGFGPSLWDWMLAGFTLFLAFSFVFKVIYNTTSFQVDHSVGKGYLLFGIYIIITWIVFTLIAYALLWWVSPILDEASQHLPIGF
jgi:hypothetical protein